MYWGLTPYAGRHRGLTPYPTNIALVRIGLQIGIVCAALAAGLMPVSAATIERRFSTTVYPALQRAITPITNTVPIALFDLLTLAAAIAVIAAIVHGIRRARRERSARPLLATLRQLRRPARSSTSRS